MKRQSPKQRGTTVLRVVLTCAFLWTAQFGHVAQAQSDDLIAGYTKISKALENAKTNLETAPQSAVSGLEAAQGTFRGLSGQIGSPQIYDAINRGLNDAQTAISRRSKTDLVAQSNQARALLQRVLYERFFAELAAGRTASAARYSGLLGRVFGLNQASAASLAAAVRGGDVQRARAILESQVATVIGTALQNARVSDKNQSYPEAVRALGTFYIVQDSPRAAAFKLQARDFSALVTTLVSNNTAALRTQIDTLSGRVQGFRNDALASVKRLGLSASAKARADAQAQKAAAQKVTAQKAAARKLAAQKIKAEKAATKNMAAPKTTKQSSAPVGVVSNTQNKARVTPAPLQTTSAPRHNGSGGLDTILSSLALANGALLAGDQNASLNHLRSARNDYEKNLRPVVNQRDPALASRASKLLATTTAAIGLRGSDIMALQSEMRAIGRTLEGRPNGTLVGLNSSIQPLWVGFVRGLLMLVLSALFVYPMYLLNLAFGGSNPYWRAIGAAMVLLFSPVMFEGLAWLGSLLYKLSGVAFFDALAGFSLLSNPISQITWALAMLAAVLLAIYGFRGIASQFGLLPGRVREEALVFDEDEEPAFQTSTSSRPAQTVSSTSNKEKVVDWDEEF